MELLAAGCGEDVWPGCLSMGVRQITGYKQWWGCDGGDGGATWESQDVDLLSCVLTEASGELL